MSSFITLCSLAWAWPTKNPSERHQEVRRMSGSVTAAHPSSSQGEVEGGRNCFWHTIKVSYIHVYLSKILSMMHNSSLRVIANKGSDWSTQQLLCCVCLCLVVGLGCFRNGFSLLLILLESSTHPWPASRAEVPARYWSVFPHLRHSGPITALLEPHWRRGRGTEPRRNFPLAEQFCAGQFWANKENNLWRSWKLQ